jgi:hypothetical protein
MSFASKSVSCQTPSIHVNAPKTEISLLDCAKTALKIAGIALKIIAAIAFLGVGSVTVFTSSIAGFVACPLWVAIPAGLALAYIGEKAAESAFQDIRAILL